MGQSKRSSFIESFWNTFIAFVIGTSLAPFVYMAWGVEIKPLQFGGVTITFTIISVLRNYLIRRYFENKKKSNK